MFKGYDPDRRPPYRQEVCYENAGKYYKTIYLVSNGYGGSISISCGSGEEITYEEYLIWERQELDQP